MTAARHWSGGKPYMGAAELKDLSPPLDVVMLQWSPVARAGGYSAPLARNTAHTHLPHFCSRRWRGGPHGLWGSGCDLPFDLGIS